MPPLGTKLPTTRTRKPPSCDHCKQKRVLCHPSPAGCPRCVEKGIECTTTPVVRRKPTRRTKNENSIAPTTPSRSTSPRASTIDPFDLPVPPASGSTVGIDAAPPQTGYDAAIAYQPVASTSACVHEPLLAPSAFDSFQLVPLHYPQPNLSVSPEVAKILFKASTHTPLHQYPVFLASSLERSLETVGWQVDLLPSHANVLAYCTFAIGALYTYHHSILDPYHLNFGGTCPQSFASVLDHLPDLRKFGKSRATACEGFRAEAIRRARESDVLFVASEEAASACHLLYWLESVAPGGHTSSSTIWAAAGMSHLRVLGRSNLFHPKDMEIRWACYLFADSIQALFIGENPPSMSDQLLLVGPTDFSEAFVDREVAELDKKPADTWPLATPHFVLSLELSRRVYEEMIGPWTRDLPFDLTVNSSILRSLEYRRRCAECMTRDHLLSGPLNMITSMRSFRMVISLSWSCIALLVYNKLREQRSKSSTWTSKNDRDDRILRSRLDFCANEARELALGGLEATIDSFRNMPSLAAWTHLLPKGLSKWAEFLLGVCDEGLVVIDSKVISWMEALSNALKQTGYVWSNPSTDSLILQLDSHVLAFQLASSNPPPSHSSDCHAPFSQSTEPSFDPTLSMFANLTSVSTPLTSSSSNDLSPNFEGNTSRDFAYSMTTTGTNGECAPPMAGTEFVELSQVLGMY